MRKQQSAARKRIRRAIGSLNRSVTKHERTHETTVFADKHITTRYLFLALRKTKETKVSALVVLCTRVAVRTWRPRWGKACRPMCNQQAAKEVTQPRAKTIFRPEQGWPQKRYFCLCKCSVTSGKAPQSFLFANHSARCVLSNSAQPREAVLDWTP